MKFYRVNYSKDGGNSGGYTWHTSKADAMSSARKDYDLNPAEYDNHAPRAGDDRIEPITITPTRAGILEALNRFASYPDNG